MLQTSSTRLHTFFPIAYLYGLTNSPVRQKVSFLPCVHARGHHVIISIVIRAGSPSPIMAPILYLLTQDSLRPSDYKCYSTGKRFTLSEDERSNKRSNIFGLATFRRTPFRPKRLDDKVYYYSDLYLQATIKQRAFWRVGS